ncbi:MAG: TetR/AcrR family transcriptional regulator [Streptosporangiaceae bacterium]
MGSSATSGARLAAAPRHRIAADEVLDAACAVFAAEGFANANMDAIAARAGMTKPTLYARFGPKERLFAAVVRREHAMLSDWVVAEHESGEDEPFHQRLHRWVGVYFDFVRERPDGFKLTFEGERHAAAAQAIEEATDDRIDRITTLVASLSGRPEGLGPRVVAAAIVGLLRWCAREAIRHPDVCLDDVQALCESMVSVAMHGLSLDVMDRISKGADAAADIG